MNKRLKKKEAGCLLLPDCRSLQSNTGRACVFPVCLHIRLLPAPSSGLKQLGLIWSILLSEKLGRNVSQKHHFWWGSWKLLWVTFLCWLSLTGRLRWIVALEMLLGCMWVAMDKCLWLLKHAGWCPKYRVDKAKSEEIQEVGLLTGKKKFLLLCSFIITHTVNESGFLTQLVLKTRIPKLTYILSVGKQAPLGGSGLVYVVNDWCSLHFGSGESSCKTGRFFTS